MSTEALLQVGNWILYAGFLGLVLFTVAYGARSRWRQTAAGRALFYLCLSQTLIITLAMLGVWFGPDWPGRPQVRIVILGFFAACSWWLLISLLRIQRRRNNGVE